MLDNAKEFFTKGLISVKKFKLFLVMIGIILLVSACGKESGKPIEQTNPSGDQQTTQTDPDEQKERKLIGSAIIPEEVYSWYKVESYVGDIDADGADEEVVLAADVECDEEGEFLWNDGQNWALYVLDRKESYLFMKEYINAGYPYFEVSDYYMADGAKPQINLIVSTGASFTLKSFTFSEEDHGYFEEILYSTKDITEGGINTRYSSLPAYHKEEE